MTSASDNQFPISKKVSTFAGQRDNHPPLYGMLDRYSRGVESATISIQGLTSGYVQPLDFCVPVTRSHPGDEDQRRKALHGDTDRNLAVEHINISTAWNGLTDVDAKELFRVHQVFVSTLEKILANELWQVYQQLQQQDSAGNIRPIHTLFSSGVIRGISFCRDQLVNEMAKVLYSSKEDTAKAKSGLLRLYLIATDALVHYHEDGSRDTSITVRVRCDPLSSRTFPVVDAAWVPDSLIFESLNEFPVEGQDFFLVPRYYSKSVFRPTHFPKNVAYSIESGSQHSPPSWLVWDDQIAGFRGVVPFYSKVNGYDRNTSRSARHGVLTALKIILQAVLVDDTGSSIRYERILRARLTINVVPWYVNNSRETKERSSVPRAYRDTRFTSATPHFSHYGHRGKSPQRLGRSPSRPSQRSEGGPLNSPNEYAHVRQVGFNDSHSTMSSLVSEAGAKEIDLPSLAETQAYLVAKCAELAEELVNIKGHVMMCDPFGEHHNGTLHVPDSQEYMKDTYSVPSYPHAGDNGSTRKSSVPRIPFCASEHLNTPSSPSIHGRDATLQLEPITRFSVLPPPAISLTTRPSLDSQTLPDEEYFAATRRGCDRTPGPKAAASPEGIFASQNIHSAQEPNHSAPPHFGARSTPPIGQGELVTLSASGRGGRKRRARSTLNQISSLKRSIETGNQPRQGTGARSAEPDTNALPLLDCEDENGFAPTQWSDGIFYNSFAPLRSLRSSTTLDGEDDLVLHASEREVSADSRRDIEHRSQDSICYTNTEYTDKNETANKKLLVGLGPGDGAIAAGSVFANSFFPDWKGQFQLLQDSSASFSPRDTSTSSTIGSSSTSSDVEFIVDQDTRTREVSRQEQARLWKLLSQSDSGKKHQPEPEGKEVRLSEDEKRAMDEAMQRSLDDLAGGFDDIFLEDSSESNLGDDP